MDFGTLKSRLLATIGRAPADVCYEMVTADINQELRLADMEATTTLTEAASITLPSDFLEVVSVYRDTDPRRPLRPETPQGMHTNHQTSGIPTTYSIVDDAGTKKMQLSPAPNGSENIVLRYFAKLSDLSADTDQNDILTNYPSIYIYGTLAHHNALIRDLASAQAYLGAYEKAKGQARANDRKNRMGGGPIVPVVRAAP